MSRRDFGKRALLLQYFSGNELSTQFSRSLLPLHSSKRSKEKKKRERGIDVDELVNVPHATSIYLVVSLTTCQEFFERVEGGDKVDFKN